MGFLEFLSLLQKRGLSYAIYEIFFSSPKTWTIICNFWNCFLFSKNMDNHMQFMKFLYLLQKRGLSYAIYKIYFSFQKTWTISYAIFWSFFPFSENVEYHMQFMKFLPL